MKNIKNSEVIKDLPIWKHFDAVLGIPRPSKHSEKISDYIYSFGKKLGCEAIKDKVGNVILRKKASSPEYENKDMLALQCHVDMVPQIAYGYSHDFTKDPIKAYIDNGFLRAEGTTLGADNGIGLSAMLTLIESKEIPHGPLEFLFTVDEEDGVAGVNSLEKGALKSKYLINLDSETEGELFIGCAGGGQISVTFDYKSVDISHELYSAYILSISGLKGGHSGADIGSGRANSIKILSRILFALKANKVDFYLSEIKGGTLRNVIPYTAEAELSVNKNDEKKFKDIVSNLSVDIKKEYKISDPFITIKLRNYELSNRFLAKDISSNLIDSLYSCHNCVYKMDEEFNVVQTSSNLAIVESKDVYINIFISIRSLINSSKLNLMDIVAKPFEFAGAKVEKNEGYSAWKPKSDSILLQVCKNVYLNMFDTLPIITVIHAGLECGVIGISHPNMEMISMGPTILDAHSVNERVDVTSVNRFFDYLCEVIDSIK